MGMIMVRPGVNPQVGNPRDEGSIPSPLAIYSVSTAGNGQYPFNVSPSGWGSIPPRCTKHAPVAQLVEHMIEDHGRVGSTPTGCTKHAVLAEID